MKAGNSIGSASIRLTQTEHERFWKWMYVLIAACCLVAVIATVLLGLPTRPNTISLAGFESRLLVPNTIAFGFILVSDPEGGLNSFVLSKPPTTYTVPATVAQSFVLPRGHYKYWVRHINAGSRIKVKMDWPSEATLQFCLILTSVESYLSSPDRCLLKLHSRSRIAFEYVSKHSGDHFFIVESVSAMDLPTDPLATEATQTASTSNKPPSTSQITLPQRSAQSIIEENARIEQPTPSGQKRNLLTSQTVPAHRDNNTPDSLPISDFGFFSTSKEADRSLLAQKPIQEAPEFFVVRANVSFDMALIQYDTNQADDLFVGSFSKEFEFNRPEWLVLYNPTDSHIYSVTISVTRRHKELLITVFLIEFILVSMLSCCCYYRYSNVTMRNDPENGLRLFSRKSRTRHLGDARSKSMDDVEAEPLQPWHNLPHSPNTEARRARKHVLIHQPSSPSPSIPST